MRARLLDVAEQRRTFALVFDTGDEVVELLTNLAEEQALAGSQITGLGALQRVTLGYFDWSAKQYAHIEVAEQVEVASLVGNIARDAEGQVKLHIHLVVGRSDGSAVAGHLLSGDVRPTLELVVTEMPHHLRRRVDDETGLPLLDV